METLKKPDVATNEASGLSNNTGSNNTRKTYDLKHMNLRKSVNNNGCDTSDEKDKEGRKLISHKALQHIVEPYQNVNLLDNDGKKKSRVTVLIEIGEYLEKFHDPNGEVYVVIIIKGHREVWPMKAKVFRDWLSHQYFQLAESGQTEAVSMTPYQRWRRSLNSTVKKDTSIVESLVISKQSTSICVMNLGV